MKPEQKLTLEHIADKLPHLQFKIKDGLRFKDNDILGPKILEELRESLEDVNLLITHYLKYPE